jgi:hypothetical protein
MSNFFDIAGKFQKQHYRGANLGFPVYNPTLYHCATLPYASYKVLANINKKVPKFRLRKAS